MKCTKTYLKAGGKYGIHTHDCDEYTTVVKAFNRDSKQW
jgi:hypothetical protein